MHRTRVALYLDADSVGQMNYRKKLKESSEKKKISSGAPCIDINQDQEDEAKQDYHKQKDRKDQVEKEDMEEVGMRANRNKLSLEYTDVGHQSSTTESAVTESCTSVRSIDASNTIEGIEKSQTSVECSRKEGDATSSSEPLPVSDKTPHEGDRIPYMALVCVPSKLQKSLVNST